MPVKQSKNGSNFSKISSSKSRNFHLKSLFIYFAGLFCVLLVQADNKPVVPAFTSWQAEKKLNTPFLNIQSLKHLNEIQLQRAMGYMSESLGVDCRYCHNENDYSSDQRAPKHRAREMIRLVQHVNRSYFGSERISCYTCHRGNAIPQARAEADQSIPKLTGNRKPLKLAVNHYKNIHQLGHLTVEENNRIMAFFITSLGVKDCGFCHTQDDFASDQSQNKIRAREMIAMTREINANFFIGEPVTCFTCHQSHSLPKRIHGNWSLNRNY